MVRHKPHASARNHSALRHHKPASARVVAAPIMTLPFKHYALICLNNDGEVKVHVSPSLHQGASTIFTPDVRQNFLGSIDFRPSVQLTLNASTPHRARRCIVNTPRSEERLADTASDLDHGSSNGTSDKVPLRIGDTGAVLAYYKRALERFQQINCRMVAKLFIKFIEPRKQANHPYTGVRPKGSAPGTTRNPEQTKPDWWPLLVRHKEPDHMLKDERILLLLHIIRELGYKKVTADKLLKIASDNKHNLKHPYAEIIYEILRVRKMEERFENGEIDANEVVYVAQGKSGPKCGDKEDPNNVTVPVPAIGHSEATEKALVSPTSSIEQAAPPATPNVYTIDPVRSSQILLPPVSYL